MTKSAEMFLTSKELWKEFELTGSLKISKISEVRYDKVTYGEYYFSGREINGESVRIFGVYATPDEMENYNAVLYIPDITEPINYEMITEYAKMGFAVLVVDLYGERKGVENYTSYPESVYYANYERRGNRMDYVEDKAYNTCWYEWVAVERYALRFLECQPNVEKIGLIGVKKGANIAWQVAATDTNVKCSVMMFGAGWSAYKSVFRYNDNNNDIELTEERRRFIAAIDAHAYAQSIRCPILYLSATNNDEFDFDRSFETLERIPIGVECSFNYAPGFKEYLDEFCQKDVELFLKKHLQSASVNFPKIPEIKVSQDKNYLGITVDCDEINEVYECKVYLNEGVINPSLRNWMTCKQVDSENIFNFEYIINGCTDKIFAFAVVKYKSGVTLTSKFISKVISPSASIKTGLVYSSRDGLDGITFYDKNVTTEKNIFVDREDFITLVKGADDIYGAYSHCGLVSYRFCEPGWNIDENSILKLDVFTAEFCSLKFIFMQKIDSETKEYVYSIDLKARSIWQNLIIKLSEFKSVEGMGMKQTEGIYGIRIEGDGKYAVNNILLI